MEIESTTVINIDKTKTFLKQNLNHKNYIKTIKLLDAQNNDKYSLIVHRVNKILKDLNLIGSKLNPKLPKIIKKSLASSMYSLFENEHDSIDKLAKEIEYFKEYFTIGQLRNKTFDNEFKHYLKSKNIFNISEAKEHYKKKVSTDFSNVNVLKSAAKFWKIIYKNKNNNNEYIVLNSSLKIKPKFLTKNETLFMFLESYLKNNSFISLFGME